MFKNKVRFLVSMTRIFTSYFPVDPTKTIDDLAKVISIWISGSPHNDISVADLNEIGKDDFKLSKQHDTIGTIRFVEGGGGRPIDLWGIQYCNSADLGTYTTEVVGSRDDKSFEVAVSVSYHTSKIGSKVHEVKKPRIVNDILKGLGGHYDGNCFDVRAEPHWIDPIDIDFVAEAMLNKSNNTLPVVYISRNTHNWSPVNPADLGFLLGGMAHVIVEPNVEFSHRISKLTSKKNAYRGAVGVYWPNGWSHKILPKDPEEMRKELFDIIAEHALYYVLPPYLTFDGLRSMRTLATIEKMKREKTASDADLLEMYTSELEEKTKRVNELEGLLQRLNQRVAQLSARPAGGMINEPDLSEFYPGEFLGIVYDAIKSYQRTVPGDSRRRVIIDGLLDCNAKPENVSELVETLKKIFKSGANMPEVIRRLTGLGFEVDSSGKHPKLSVPGYSAGYTFPSTPSDQRGAENTVSGIKNKLL